MKTKNLQQAMEEYIDRIAEIMVNELFENGSFVSGDLAKSVHLDASSKVIYLKSNAVD